MDKILFIVPPYVSYDTFVNPAYNDGVTTKKGKKFRNVVADIPMGLISLSAYLKQYAEVDIRLIDYNIIMNKLESFEFNSFIDFYQDILAAPEWVDFQPDIVGVSALFTPSYYNMLDISKVARKLFPDAINIAGGGLPTSMYKDIYNETDSFDALCYGEGEKPLRELLAAADRKQFLHDSPSWITKDKVQKNILFKHDFIVDLDEIPFADYSILDLSDYHLNPVLGTFPLAKEKMSSTPMSTSRGCVHRCSFCASHTVHGRDMRFHSVRRLKEDFLRLKEQFGTKSIVFFDDHFMANKKRVFEIVDVLNELELTAFFPASLTLYALDRKTLEALKSVGLNDLVLSVESGSDKVLRSIMRKPLNLSIVKQVIKDCRELGIATDVAILIGMPGETKQDIEDTRIFLKTLDATWFRINIATPLVGTEMLDICLKNNYLKGNYIDCDFKRAIVETEDFTADYIQEKVYALNLELNFVSNSEYRLGNYEAALLSFENTLRVKDDHAFAYYYAAKCYKQMGKVDRYQAYKSSYQKIVDQSTFWNKYVNEFDLSALD